MYLIGEALMGNGPEIAHIDLVIGDKEGPAGNAFANSLSNLSAGHTPLIAVIRPNLPSKPYTLLVPKVTVENLEQAEKIFGPAQTAVAKAVADSVEEGIIPKDKIEDWVIICSVFVHPEAKDARKIYQYNYGATKLAIKRALINYPTLEKIMYDKDRAKHPIMGFKVPRLWRPPYLQILFDIPEVEKVKRVVSELPKSDRITLEVGTPLVEKYGVKIVRDLREIVKEAFIIVDLKTPDLPKVQVDVAFDDTADAVVVSGQASTGKIDEFIYEARRLGIYAFVDIEPEQDPVNIVKSLKGLPDVIVLNLPTSVKASREFNWEIVKEIRRAFEGRKLLIGVSGIKDPATALKALQQGTDILVVGRYITQSRDVRRSVREFLTLTEEMKEDIDLYRVHVE